MDNRRVLLCGASGFIGRWSIPALRRLGFEVHAVVSANSRAAPVQLAGVAVHAADLLDPASVDELMAAVRPSHLLHFAWIATPGIYWRSEANYRWLEASEYLLRAFATRGGERMVMAGSCAEYAWTGPGVCIEGASALADRQPGPLAPYVACKLAMQRVLESATRQYGCSSAWGRIFFQFGPAEHPDRLVPSVVRQLLSNQPALCTHGRQVRSFLHVDDVGAAFAALLDSRLQGPVNIGSARRISVADLVGMIAAQIGRPDLIRLGAKPAVPGEPDLLVPDIGRLHGELHWSPRLTLEDGLADAIAWWRRELAA